MRFPLEAVPNFSEGRDAETIAALGRALAAHAALLDVHSDPDHHRSVFTLAGSEEELVASLLAGIACARERIDLRRHGGVHPRVGAADVVPIVAVRPQDMARAKEAARTLARRVGEELELPVFLYGELAPGRGPAFFRRGGLEELARRLAAGELRPDFGPERLDERAGCVLVGARRPLVAFNVNLETDDLEAARAIAARVREAGGGFPGVRALGLALPSRGLVQVSMNIEDPDAVPLQAVVARIAEEAQARGLRLAGSELVGLLPATCASQAAAAALLLPRLEPSQLLELRLWQLAGAGRDGATLAP
jgi:glutamate formiminotransferase/glutamate formiminotransferase/formiminotetrahydrofolate cyclodeaminase